MSNSRNLHTTISCTSSIIFIQPASFILSAFIRIHPKNRNRLPRDADPDPDPHPETFLASAPPGRHLHTCKHPAQCNATRYIYSTGRDAPFLHARSSIHPPPRLLPGQVDSPSPSARPSLVLCKCTRVKLFLKEIAGAGKLNGCEIHV